jgi:hypothetical protein
VRQRAGHRLAAFARSSHRQQRRLRCRG